MFIVVTLGILILIVAKYVALCWMQLCLMSLRWV